jgi:hypothetical protein
MVIMGDICRRSLQDNMDQVIHNIMELGSSKDGTMEHLVSLCYRTPALAKISTKAFKGLYPNTPPVPEGASGEF